MKVFMRNTYLTNLNDETWEATYNQEWVQVYENDWDEEDLYIDDKLHGSRCWGDCYDKSDLRYLVERRKKNDNNYS